MKIIKLLSLSLLSLIACNSFGMEADPVFAYPCLPAWQATPGRYDRQEKEKTLEQRIQELPRELRLIIADFCFPSFWNLKNPVSILTIVVMKKWPVFKSFEKLKNFFNKNNWKEFIKDHIIALDRELIRMGLKETMIKYEQSNSRLPFSLFVMYFHLNTYERIMVPDILILSSIATTNDMLNSLSRDHKVLPEMDKLMDKLIDDLKSLSLEQGQLLDEIYTYGISKNHRVLLTKKESELFETFIPEIKEAFKPYVIQHAQQRSCATNSTCTIS